MGNGYRLSKIRKPKPEIRKLSLDINQSNPKFEYRNFETTSMMKIIQSALLIKEFIG